jgi:hypothetical protein
MGAYQNLIRRDKLLPAVEEGNGENEREAELVKTSISDAIYTTANAENAKISAL